MPRTTREVCKRLVKQSINNLDRVKHDLTILFEIYQDDYPIEAGLVGSLIELTDMQIANVAQFYQEYV